MHFKLTITIEDEQQTPRFCKNKNQPTEEKEKKVWYRQGLMPPHVPKRAALKAVSNQQPSGK